MLNKDINSRFEDWLISPRETLDFEVKRWLDMSDVECQGLVAKALIALENHGGGFLLFGYLEDEDKVLVPDPNRPASLEPYSTDALNAILKKRAEPVFHIEVTVQKHPQTGQEYPLVRVSGRSKVPVRSDSATAQGSLKQHVYYIRAPGPESRGPLDGSEWDALLRRSVQNQRDEIVGLLRSILPGATDLLSVQKPDEQEELHQFSQACTARWNALNESLPPGHPAKISTGYFSFSARIVGTSKALSLAEIMRRNEACRKYTGWPTFVSMQADATRPHPVDGGLQTWTAHSASPDVGHADFWRIEPQGNFFLLRGYQEDSSGAYSVATPPGRRFEVTLPVWRFGEFLLRVLELGAAMYETGFQVLVECNWTGLRGRSLFSHNMRRYIPSGHTAHNDIVTTHGQFSQQAGRDLLPEAVKVITRPLFEHFDFAVLPDALYTEELGEMTNNRF